ncbi:response regulator [bacterium]|nr:response regulator [bacterium]
MNNQEKNILIVDDDETLRDTLVFDFKRKGFNVYSAENGSKALEIVRSAQIHLVLSDIRMPGGDGISLLETLRKIDPNIPVVIFLTGFAEITEEDCIKKGAKKVIPKPFDRKQLFSSVMEALAS